MLTITQLRVNHAPLGDTLRSHIAASAPSLSFSWAAVSIHRSNRQRTCHITISDDDQHVLWDSGTVETAQQCLVCPCADTLPKGTMLHVSVTISDAFRETSEPKNDYFYLADVTWNAPWIGSPTPRLRTDALYFRKTFSLDRPVRNARLYACGIGYQRVSLNGRPLDEGLTDDWPLDPAVTDFSKQAQYVLYPDIQDELLQDDNCLGIIVGLGWRDNSTTKNIDESRPQGIPFRGDPLLTAMLVIDFQDGTSTTIVTDDSWTVSGGPITYNDLFNGTTYDARLEIPGWDEPPHHHHHDDDECECECAHARADYEPPQAAIRHPADGLGQLVPMELPPIASAETRQPIDQWSFYNDCILDFGQNLAGVLRIRIPAGLREGTVIQIAHTEELDENGYIYSATLRSAKATDTYIASGREDGTTWFQPPFTYHGFRYAHVTGLGPAISPDAIVAVSLRNNLDKPSFFVSGNPLINKIHDCCLETERANTHGILTDCPQRDERMGWLNDATVRFEAFPYAFESATMFRKIIQDCINGQSPEGGIACTEPYVFGSQPADPVCSSFLIAGRELYAQTGDKAFLAYAFDAFRAWTDCLLAHSDNYIVNYSNYGDWAAPDYACDKPGGARSGVTPGIFMSTGYSYFNCRTIVEFARILGRYELVEEYEKKADAVRQAMLDKWYDPATATFATGSMATTVFPLWLGIFPKGDAYKAAKRLNQQLIDADFRFTTGNLCTRYLFEVLCDYGFQNTAYQLITRDTYPSFGYMIQQEATTIWERFELKKDAGMNSHCHPMYGAIYHWFYAYLAGIRFTEPGCREVLIQPSCPTDLLSVHCGVSTELGMLTIRWTRRYDTFTLHVNIPFGMTALIILPNGQRQHYGSGFHTRTASLYSCS